MILQSFTQFSNHLNEIKPLIQNDKELMQNAKQIQKIFEDETRKKYEELAKLKEQLEKENKKLQNELNSKDKDCNDKLNSKNKECDNKLNSKDKDCNDKLGKKDEEIKKLKADLQKCLESSKQKIEEIKENIPVDCKQLYDELKKILSFQIETIKKLTPLMNKQPAEIINKFNKIKSSIETLNISDIITKDYKAKDNQVECDELDKAYKIWGKQKDTFETNNNDLINLNEDIGGAVRVYIKIKPIITSNDTSSITIKNNNTLNVSCTKTNFGPFYNIFSDKFNNRNIFMGNENTSTSLTLGPNEQVGKNGLYNTIKQIESGYSVVLFGYGLSGSGKTYTLLGNNTVPGLIHYTLSNLNNVTNISIQNAFELYAHDVLPTMYKVKGTIINIVSSLPDAYNDYKEKDEKNQIQMLYTAPQVINKDNIKDDINKKLLEINDFRVKNKHITETPNNPESSRTHLFIIFKITFNNNKVGYFTVIDSGGRESTKDLVKFFQNPEKGMKLTPETILSNKKPEAIQELIVDNYYLKVKKQDGKMYTAENIYDMFKESYYINRSVDDLIYFFKKKSNIQEKKLDSDKNKYKTEDEKRQIHNENIEKREYNNKVDVDDTSLMIPILKYLDTGLNMDKSKPTKFITIVNVRQEQKYCDQTVETLNFAQQIKST